MQQLHREVREKMENWIGNITMRLADLVDLVAVQVVGMLQISQEGQVVSGEASNMIMTPLSIPFMVQAQPIVMEDIPRVEDLETIRTVPPLTS